jgi:hypothetical protein
LESLEETERKDDAQKSARVSGYVERRKQQRRQKQLGAAASRHQNDQRVNPGRRLEDWLRKQV